MNWPRLTKARFFGALFDKSWPLFGWALLASPLGLMPLTYAAGPTGLLSGQLAG